jgi:hypothetical protein
MRRSSRPSRLKTGSQIRTGHARQPKDRAGHGGSAELAPSCLPPARRLDRFLGRGHPAWVRTGATMGGAGSRVGEDRGACGRAGASR